MDPKKYREDVSFVKNIWVISTVTSLFLLFVILFTEERMEVIKWCYVVGILTATFLSSYFFDKLENGQ